MPMITNETPNKEKLKFKTNIPYNVTLNFDEPKTGESKFGTYYLYGCTHEGEERVFFATEILHTIIQYLKKKKGSELTILKEERDDNKTYFSVDGQDIGSIKVPIEGTTPKISDGDLPF